MRIVVEGQTRRSREGGLALLRESPWSGQSNFLSGARGYLAALRRGTDWQEVHRELRELVRERNQQRVATDPERKLARTEQEQVDLALAQEWGRRDLDSAIGWYVGERSATSTIEQRTLAVLRSVPAEERHRVADWLEGNFGAGERNDRLVAEYARTLAGRAPDDLAHRLVTIPFGEQHRVAIVSAFAKPSEKDGRLILRHPPDALRRLVEAANLSPGERGRWLTTIEEASWTES